jgi:hypothetical protein
MKFKVTIRKHKPVQAEAARWQAAEEHAKRPPACAGKAAVAGWQRNENAHQDRYAKLLSPAVAAKPATFSFSGWFGPQHESMIARAIVARYGLDVAAYPSSAEIEI